MEVKQCGFNGSFCFGRSRIYLCTGVEATLNGIANWPKVSNSALSESGTRDLSLIGISHSRMDGCLS